MIYVGVFFSFFPFSPPFIVLLSSLTAGTEILVKLQKQMSLNALNYANSIDGRRVLEDRQYMLLGVRDTRLASYYGTMGLRNKSLPKAPLKVVNLFAI